MESKIQIDINSDGGPVIRIDHKISKDVRDRLIARFATSPRPLEQGERLLYALEGESKYVHEDEGIVFKIVPLHQILPKGEKPLLKEADEWAVKNMPPDLYQKWVKDIINPNRY